MAISKRFKKAAEGLDPTQSYTVEEAVKLVKSRAPPSSTKPSNCR
jgi:hypothetical protein